MVRKRTSEKAKPDRYSTNLNLFFKIKYIGKEISKGRARIISKIKPTIKEMATKLPSFSPSAGVFSDIVSVSALLSRVYSEFLNYFNLYLREALLSKLHFFEVGLLGTKSPN